MSLNSVFQSQHQRFFAFLHRIQAAIEYIHLNPVKRGLCELPTDWRWSSARQYSDQFLAADNGVPPVTGCIHEIFD